MLNFYENQNRNSKLRMKWYLLALLSVLYRSPTIIISWSDLDFDIKWASLQQLSEVQTNLRYFYEFQRNLE